MSTTSPVPVGDLPGWRQTYSNDFDTDVAVGGFQFGSNGALLTTAAAYGPYFSKVAGYRDGTQDTSKVGEYRPSATLSVVNSRLICAQSVIGGVPVGAHIHPIPAGVSPTNGAWTQPAFRMLRFYGRMFGTTTRFGFVGLMISPNNPTPSTPDPRYWPWGGELDFPEGGVGSSVVQGNHHLALQGGGFDEIDFPGIDRTVDHEYRIIWTPGNVRYQVDSTFVDTQHAVSAVPMSTHLQGATTGTAPLSTDTGQWEIDWIAEYQYTGTAQHRIARLRGSTFAGGAAAPAKSAGAAPTPDTTVELGALHRIQRLVGSAAIPDTTEPRHRIQRLRGVASAVIGTTGARHRIARLRGLVSAPVQNNPLTATLTGPAQAEAFEVVTLDASASTNATAWLFTQVSGPTVTLTGTGNRRTFVGPVITDGAVLTFRVTVSAAGQGDKTADWSVQVMAPSEYFVLGNGTLAPVEQYLV